MSHFIPPQPVLVEDREAVDYDGDGEGEDEDAGEGAEAADQLAKQSLGVQLVPDRCDSH